SKPDIDVYQYLFCPYRKVPPSPRTSTAAGSRAHPREGGRPLPGGTPRGPRGHSVRAMSTATPEQIRRAAPAAARTTLLAGWSLMIIAALHTVVFFPQIPWGEWFGGGLRTDEPDME